MTAKLKKSVIAPKDGYENEAKQLHREKVWNSFPQYVFETCSKTDNAYVLIFPSREGLEIPLIISMGIPEEKIIAIDNSPAEIALSKWRKEYPKVKFYGSNLSEVGHKMKKNNQVLIAANLDLCNNFSHKLISELNGFFKNTPTFQNFCFSITIAKGRESTEVNTLLDIVNKDKTVDIEDKRMSALINCLDIFKSSLKTTSELCSGNYISGKIPMTFSVFKFWSVDCFNIEYGEVIERAVEVSKKLIDLDENRNKYSAHRNKESLIKKMNKHIENYHTLYGSYKDELFYIDLEIRDKVISHRFINNIRLRNICEKNYKLIIEAQNLPRRRFNYTGCY